MEFGFFKITIYLKTGEVKSNVVRYWSTPYSAQDRANKNAEATHGKQNIVKVDVWRLPETDPEVVEYKRRWL